MNEKGFVTSALLYGILSLFLVLILGTLSVITSRKLASDRLKESALNDVQNLRTSESCFTIDSSTCTITGYDQEKCGKTVFIDKNNIKQCELNKIGPSSFQNISNGYVYIKSNIDIDNNAFAGNTYITFITVNIGTENDGKTNGGEVWGAKKSILKAY